jgi:uncharacterized protein (TIGR02118 family)
LVAFTQAFFYISSVSVNLANTTNVPDLFMIKLIALYREPADIQAFEDHYTEKHTPLIQKMPGLKKLEVSRVNNALAGDARYYLIASMYFENEDTLNAALASPEGKAAGKDLMDFAAGIVSLLVAEVTG